MPFSVTSARFERERAQIYFASTARESEDREILGAQAALKASVVDTGLFSDVQVLLVDRDMIIEMWKSSEGQVEATLRVIGSAAFRKAPGIEEGYVVPLKQRILSSRC